MIGKSWDGSVAYGVAATGVAALWTIVPISSISSWHDAYFSQEVLLVGPRTGARLVGEVESQATATRCAAVNDTLRGSAALSGDWLWSRRALGRQSGGANGRAIPSPTARSSWHGAAERSVSATASATGRRDRCAEQLRRHTALFRPGPRGLVVHAVACRPLPLLIRLRPPSTCPHCSAYFAEVRFSEVWFSMEAVWPGSLRMCSTGSRSGRGSLPSSRVSSRWPPWVWSAVGGGRGRVSCLKRWPGRRVVCTSVRPRRRRPNRCVCSRMRWSGMPGR
nr:hypothetical protein OG781_31420 [Streptomyces sp. NBC_00830]